MDCVDGMDNMDAAKGSADKQVDGAGWTAWTGGFETRPYSSRRNVPEAGQFAVEAQWGRHQRLVPTSRGES